MPGSKNQPCITNTVPDRPRGRMFPYGNDLMRASTMRAGHDDGNEIPGYIRMLSAGRSGGGGGRMSTSLRSSVGGAGSNYHKKTVSSSSSSLSSSSVGVRVGGGGGGEQLSKSFNML